MQRIEIKDVTKHYSKKHPPAVKQFTYSFGDGVYALLGPNGSGKSTLFHLIVGNLTAESGQILYYGQDHMSMGSLFREKLGFMPQQQQLYENFTIRRFLFYFAALKGLSRKQANERINELLNLFNLSSKARTRIKKLSGGMKQRVLLSQALLQDPEILLLDEPTAGLDPKERINLRNYIEKISERKTVIFATHVISDVEKIADEVIFIKNGEIILSGKKEEILALPEFAGCDFEEIYMRLYE